MLCWEFLCKLKSKSRPLGGISLLQTYQQGLEFNFPATAAVETCMTPQSVPGDQLHVGKCFPSSAMLG